MRNHCTRSVMGGRCNRDIQTDTDCAQSQFPLISSSE